MATQTEAIKPPRTEVGLLGWLKKNLFSTWYNALLTIFSVAFVYVALRGIITWVVRESGPHQSQGLYDWSLSW